jgi:hypothetical protein
MPFTSVTPELVPHFSGTAHIVLDGFGKAGRVYRETAGAVATFESVVGDLLNGQFNNPVRVIAFNASQGWSRDVSEDVAREVLRRVAGHVRPLTASSRKFVETYVDEDELLRAESGVA